MSGVRNIANAIANDPSFAKTAGMTAAQAREYSADPVGQTIKSEKQGAAPVFRSQAEREGGSEASKNARGRRNG